MCCRAVDSFTKSGLTHRVRSSFIHSYPNAMSCGVSREQSLEGGEIKRGARSYNKLLTSAKQHSTEWSSWVPIDWMAYTTVGGWHLDLHTGKTHHLVCTSSLIVSRDISRSFVNPRRMRLTVVLAKILLVVELNTPYGCRRINSYLWTAIPVSAPLLDPDYAHYKCYSQDSVFWGSRPFNHITGDLSPLRLHDGPV